MKTNVKISSYIEGRFNETKLEKLRAELQKGFDTLQVRDGQSIPEQGLDITISMSAKYQTPYISCEGWGQYQSVGEFEDIIKEALDKRGFEVTEEGDDEDCLKISFE